MTNLLTLDKTETRHGVPTNVLFHAAVRLALPVAIWRQPRAVQPAGVVSFAPPAALPTVDLGANEPGFVLAPFSDSSPALMLTADARLEDGVLTVDRGETGDALLALLGADDNTDAPAWYSGPPTADRALGETEFTALVKDAVSFIRARRIAKVVVSRTAPVPLPSGFAPANLFATLCTRYPDAFVSLVAIPGVGTWIGASPELLLDVDDSHLRTMALAGTQRLAPGADLSRITWGAKEQSEQEMVSDYIRSVFGDAAVSPVRDHGPRTVAAGSVAHLQTIFETVDPVSTEQANAVLDRLHPTSAVCGMPRLQALQFIEAREGYDRGYYSGYLGPVNWGGRSTIYVNLRCMQVRSSTASLYVGAGVTADSQPASEWVETTLKARTILDALDEVAVPQAETL